MMAASRSQYAACRLVEDRTMELETEAHRTPDYNGVVVTDDMLLVIDWNAINLKLYRRCDCKLMSTHRLEYVPRGVCRISKTEFAVCLNNSTILILSIKSIDDVEEVKTLDVRTGFCWCGSMAKLNSSNKLVVSGWKVGCTLWWCVVNLTDGCVDSTHKVGYGYIASGIHLAVKDNTVYISCRTDDPTTSGVYAYDIFNPRRPKFLYRPLGFEPNRLMVDVRNFIYVCDSNSNSIHQLTDSGQLVTIHTLSSRPYGIFYDDQHGVLYTTRDGSNVITAYRLEYSHQPGIPREILNMDDRSIQLFEEALKDGREAVYSIRIMVVGHIGVGKTTLVKRLLGEEVNISDRCSTEGIDVHVNCCDVSLSTSEWTRRTKDSEQDYRLQRLARVLNEQQSMKDKANHEEQVIIPHQGETTHKSHEVARIAVEGEESEVVYIRSPEHDVGQNLSSTASQQEESHPALAQREPIRSETNMIAMLKLLQENVYKLKLDADKMSPLTIWDFAGQYAYYTTHQTFLTRRAIYLLVSDVSKELADFVADECYFDSDGIMKCKVHELFEVWLNSIHSCALSKEASIPPVILVGTHVDKISQSSHHELHEICERYFRDIRYCLIDKPCRFHLVDEDFAIDNTVVDIKLEGLKRKIVEVASQQPYWGEEIPARWILLEQELMRLRAAGVKVIPLSLMKDLNQTGGIPISIDELDLFLQYHHDIGTILYFSIDILNKKIVLDPQWMIDALKSLITAEMFVLRSIPAVADKWVEFKKKGKLSLELIDALWTKEKHPDLHDNKEHMLLLMEQLNMIAKLRIYNEETSKIKEENYFLAPCMLRQKTPREVICPLPHPQMESSSVLCYVFVGKFLPSPIFHRLLAACVTHWPIATKKKEEVLENLIFCGCCVFQLGHHHRLTLHFRDYIIFMRVTRMGSKDTPSSKLCIGVREFVTATLIKIIGYLGQSLKFEYFIQCPEYNGDSINSLIPVSVLNENAEVGCELHDNMIESYKLLQFWFENTKKTEPSEQIHSDKSVSPSQGECQVSVQKRALPRDKKYHAFFSYSNSDIQWVKQTVGRLENDHGFVCCEYDRDNTPGTPLLKFAGDSIRNAYKTVVVMTKEAFESGFVLLEVDMAINQGFVEMRKCVVPVLLKDCEVPHHLQVLNYIDARNTNIRDIWWPKLLIELEAQDTARQRRSFDISHPGTTPRISQTDPQGAQGSTTSDSAKKQKEGNPGGKGGGTGAQGSTTSDSAKKQKEGNPGGKGGGTGVPCSDPKLLCQILNKSQQAASSSQATLEVNCLSVGLELHGETLGNGNCFFEAVSSQLQRLNCGVQKSPQQLRQEVVAFMRTNRVLHTPEGTINLDDFIYNETYDDYCTRMARNGEWADHVVVVAMARKLQMDIFIVTSSPSSGPDDIIVWVVGQTGFQGMPILLGHIWESHYLSLQPIAHLVLVPDLVGRSSPAPTAGVMKTAASGSTTIDLMPAMSASTTTDDMKAPTSGSIPSITTDVMQDPTSASTTTDDKQAPTSGSIPSITIDDMQAPTSGSLPSITTDDMKAPTSGSIPSTTTDDMQAPTSGSIPSITTDVMQAPTSGSTPSITTDDMQAPSSASKTMDVMQGRASGSTTNVMQTPTSGSATTDIIQVPASGSKPSTTACPMPVQSSCYTACGLLQPQASSSIPSTTADGMKPLTSSSTTAYVMQPPSVDTDRFMHIAYLLINVRSRVLRRLMIHHTVTATCTLDQYLAKNRIDIDNLRNRKILTKSQMDILFPPGGSTNLIEYDITLLSALFTNIVPTISQQQLNMIQFLRDERNKIFAHARSVIVNSNDYQTFWNDICTALVALSKQCGDPDFENDILQKIQDIQISIVQDTSFLDTLQTCPRRIETLDRLFQDFISSRSQESKETFDDSDS